MRLPSSVALTVLMQVEVEEMEEMLQLFAQVA